TQQSRPRVRSRTLVVLPTSPSGLIQQGRPCPTPRPAAPVPLTVTGSSSAAADCSPTTGSFPGSTALVCTRSGGYEGYGRVIQPSEFPEAARGDEVTIHDGILKYGIDSAATFTHSHQGEFGWPRTFTARELDRYLA